SNQRLYLELKLNSPEVAAVERALAQIFAGPNNSFAALVPDFWRSYFLKETPASSPQPKSATNSQPAKRITIAGGVAQGNLTHRVNPVYPQIAKMYGIHGDVVLQAMI